MQRLARHLLLLVCVFFASCRAPTPIDEGELLALFERAKKIRSFHAIYDLDQGAPADAFEDVQLEIAYQAPGQAFMRLSYSGDVFEMWCDAGRIVVHDSRRAPGKQWSSISSRSQDPAASCVSVCLTWPGLDGSEQFVPWLDFRPAESVPLSWIGLLRTSGTVGRQNDRIYWSGRLFRCWLSASTGLVEWLGFTTPDGFDFTLDLEELTLDEPIRGELFQPPPEAAQALPLRD